MPRWSGKSDILYYEQGNSPYCFCHLPAMMLLRGEPQDLDPMPPIPKPVMLGAYSSPLLPFRAYYSRLASPYLPEACLLISTIVAFKGFQKVLQQQVWSRTGRADGHAVLPRPDCLDERTKHGIPLSDRA